MFFPGPPRHLMIFSTRELGREFLYPQLHHVMDFLFPSNLATFFGNFVQQQGGANGCLQFLRCFAPFCARLRSFALWCAQLLPLTPRTCFGPVFDLFNYFGVSGPLARPRFHNPNCFQIDYVIIFCPMVDIPKERQL